jgi:beta-lactamase superfamily II metal-dependent hydrolase
MALTIKNSKNTGISEAHSSIENLTSRLIPPKNAAIIRMYRIGHGDCFLLAFPGQKDDRPIYVLIDCGYKPGSPAYINTKPAEITKSIREATGGHIDVAVITHEHQDHVNGITESNFEGITIGETWFAWTEDPNDDLANRLRKAYKDRLFGIIAARNRLAAVGEPVNRIDEFLSLELGSDDAEGFNFATAASAAQSDSSKNKQSMKILTDLAKSKVKYLRPHEKIIRLPGAPNTQVFVLGPPRNTERLEDLNPQGSEEFNPSAFGAASSGSYFSAASAAENELQSPFASRYTIPKDQALKHQDFGAFFTDLYGSDTTDTSPLPIRKPMLEVSEYERNEIPGNPDWRRIDKDWLFSADQLAIAMSNETNNASLVLAFELGEGGKVLLFAADAQRGNWISWTDKDWKDGEKNVNTKELLSRTVLYKVGHHGSHNATLNGKLKDPYPNLSWMADGEYASEFTAMITAVRHWAETQKGWDHPLKAIKDALLKKAGGRVFQTDCELKSMKRASESPKSDWESFQSRSQYDRLYFDYQVEY